jgi:Rieske Fe-S protein
MTLPQLPPEQQPLDATISDESRLGLTGTTPASVYRFPVREQITLPPDGRQPGAQPDWRKDFPVDWPQDHYVARRDFTKFLVLTSLAFAVGQIWIATQNWWRRRRKQPPIVKVAQLSALPVGGAMTFRYPGEHDSCILIRPAPDILVAYAQECTHLACAVIPLVENGVIKCPCHEGYFDLRTGDPIAGPPPRALPRITLKLNGDDIYATGVLLRSI